MDQDKASRGVVAAPVPRLTLRVDEAAASLGVSIDSYRKHVQPHVRVIRRGRVKLVMVTELTRWAEANAELKALRWEDVDLDAGVLRVERGWDNVEGEITPKSREGHRTVPRAGVLRQLLLEHRMRQGRRDGLVFGRTPATPQSDIAVRKRAAKAWQAAGLTPITLHECHHTFASLMIAAGVNAKALSRYMGHFSIVVTLDLYGHLMPGNEDEAAAMLDDYLTRVAARVA